MPPDDNALERIIEMSEDHGTFLKDIKLDLNKQALKCEFPTIEAHEYLLANRGNMVIIAGRTGNGKTALASQIALNVAKHSKVLYFSLEMNKEAIAERLISVVSQIPIKKLKNPIFSERIKEAYHILNTCQLKIIDTPKLTLNQLFGMVYDENRRVKVELVVIDYIGLLSTDKSDKRHLDLSQIAHAIKAQADKLKIPFLVLGQMNQMIDSRLVQASIAKAYGKEIEVRPILSDLGESKGIADSADVVMFIRRPCLYNTDEPRSLFTVYVCKNRNGTTQDFNLEFSEELTMFIDRGDYL